MADKPPLRIHEFVRQLDFVGTQSVFLIVLTGAFTGMVSALQGYNGMHRYGAEGMVGATVALALARELGPVISALMLVGRVGSAMTVELGSMRNTQQIDALSSMAVEPVQYLWCRGFLLRQYPLRCWPLFSASPAWLEHICYPSSIWAWIAARSCPEFRTTWSRKTSPRA